MKLEKYIYENYEINYIPQLVIVNLRNEKEDLTHFLQNIWFDPNFHNYSHHLYENTEFCSVLESKLSEVFKLANSIKQRKDEIYSKEKNGEIYSLLGSHCFECLSIYSNYLRKFHLYHNAITFWHIILQMTENWEKNNKDSTVHKGTIYGFIAEIYMSLGEVEMAFTLLHRAVLEDFEISKYIEGYPKAAPGYKIVTLKGSENHFMNYYVDNIREGIKVDINVLNESINIQPPFSIEEFDDLLITNEMFDSNELYENLKINISYYIWHIYYYSRRISIVKENTPFDNMNKLQKLFGMCVIIETITKKIVAMSDSSIRNVTKALFIMAGGNENEFENGLYRLISKKDDIIGDLISELLEYKNMRFNEYVINPEIKCVFIYHVIRNFSAHNSKSIDIIGKKFFEIYRALFFLLCIFLRKKVSAPKNN